MQQLPDGNYQFVGRKDRQIKSRGYRIELDEVEAALVSHPQLEEVAAYTVADEAGNQQIEAAVMVKSNATVSQAQLMRYAAERLPAYAVPRQIAIAAVFPRTGTGKIDRLALQSEALARCESLTDTASGKAV